MSSILWDGDNLIQKVGDNLEELGHVKYDENSKDYVLWLKDTRDVFSTNKGYIRSDSFPSMKDVKQNAASSVSARIFHHMWMVGLRDGGIDTGKDVAQDIKDAESGKQPDISTVIAEIKEMQEKLDRAENNTSEREKKSKKREKLSYVIAAVSIVISVVT